MNATSYRSLFIDTWGWLALGHRRDNYHQIVKKIYQQVRQNKVPLYTSDYVLDELTRLLFQREIFQEAVTFVEGILQSAEIKILSVEHVSAARFLSAWHLRKQFQDKPRISFTDFTSMVIMKELKIQHILTKTSIFYRWAWDLSECLKLKIFPQDKFKKQKLV